MIASIIICTCNRADDLRRTLAALAGLCVPEDIPTELLVVDNGSTDATAAVVRACGLSNLPVRYVYEPRRGKGHAYNRGLAEAQGAVFLFTDDDVRPPRDWIAGMCGPILRGECDAVAGGVKIADHLVQPWMTAVHRGMLASTESMNPDEPYFMVGANMAFSRRILEKVPQFDTRLGPGALGFYDESLFSWQLIVAGFRLGSALDVAVEHHPDPNRICRAAFLETQRKYGSSLGYIDYHWRHKTIRAVTARILMRQARLFLAALTQPRRQRHLPFPTPEEMEHTYAIAFLKQYRRERGTPHRYAPQGLRKLTQE